MAILIYIVFCFFVSITGSGKPIGYWGVFGWSLLLSPLIGGLVGIFSKEFPEPTPLYKCMYCGLIEKVNHYYCPRCCGGPEELLMQENVEKYKDKEIN